VPDLEKSFINYYNQEHPKRFILHKSYPRSISDKDDTKDNGDITNPKTVRLFGEQLKADGADKVDFITADGGFEWTDETIQEQEAFRLVFAEMYNAVKIQAKGGHFVLKLFETYTNTSCKFIYIMGQLYEHIHLVKPLMGRPSNSEKYIVCINFKYNESNSFYKHIMRKLDHVFQELFDRTNSNLPNKNLIDIWPDLELSPVFKKTITLYNTQVANTQVKYLNEINTYIREQNFHGSKYNMYREIQITCTKYWINRFMNMEPEAQIGQTKLIRKETQELVNRNSTLVKV